MAFTWSDAATQGLGHDPRPVCSLNGTVLSSSITKYLSWPELELWHPPDSATAKSLARRIRAALGLGPGRISMRQCCSAAEIEFRQGSLHPEHGGCEALLVPLRSGSFRIVVDATPRGGWGETPTAIRPSVARHRTRFRVAHELAHTFFFTRRAGQPVRLFPGGSAAEERFADEFARALLAPIPSSGVSASAVVALQSEWDVSLEVAVRACAEAPGVRGATIWRWSPAAQSSQSAVVQWATGRAVGDVLGIGGGPVPYKCLIGSLERSSEVAGISFAVLDERCQALALLS
jgi:hypothetical protein